jgi:hypothetical protein
VPGLPSGVYELDPDGAGSNPAFGVFCDMVTDGGGWTFFAHVNQDYAAGDFFEKNVGAFRADRVDDNTTYARGEWLLPYVSHTQMMVALDGADPNAAEAAHKLIVYQYGAGVPGFNRGPVPCVGLAAAFAYRTTRTGSFAAGASATCDADFWYPAALGGTDYLSLLGRSGGAAGVYWGRGMLGDQSWGHDGAWYVR